MRRSAVIASVFLFCLAAAAFGQAADFQQLISGTAVPHSLKLKDLDPTWRSITVATTDQAGSSYSDMMSKLMQIGMMRGGGGGAESMAGMAMLGGMFGGSGGGASTLSFTKGQTVSVAGETFLVTYKLAKTGPDMMDLIMESASSGKEPDMEAMLKGSAVTGEALVGLTLVNVKSITSLGSLRPFDLPQALAEANKGNDMLKAMGAARHMTEETATPAAPEPVKTAPKPTTKPKPRTGK